ncbi:uncharacterized protein LOC119679090 [Teleopsis dalmanni]|uniref:uncharacterized protein LOC119679090 n=1 Tax=Teleopsis dalmanni TaxID=139649 RepID=UPI0018CD6240|nr:uncharacterized protein LOC119679090 [Teleopsis dalmanni]
MPKSKNPFIEESSPTLNQSKYFNCLTKVGFWILVFLALLLFRNWEYLYLNNDTVLEKKNYTISYKYDSHYISIKPLKIGNKKYFVYTTHCHMPSINPFSAKIKKIFQPLKYKNCTNDEPLVSVLYDTNKEKYLLHIEIETFLSQYKNANNSEAANQLSCCYRQIVRIGTGDNSYKLLPCENFAQNFEVPEYIEFIIVECSKNSTIIQKDAFSFIQYKNKTKRTTSTTRRKPSVFLIGIDSLSRMNFRRTMPQTHQYLEENDWFEMQGYNKIGDNTFPNLMALLNGNNESVVFRDCEPERLGGLDKCYFIWQDYQKLSYRTAYAEDYAIIGTFNYILAGFKKQPTDYYMRPMTLAIEKNLKVQKKANLYYCVGRKHYATYIYDYALQLANRYKDEPTFGLFWTNSFSHERYDTSATMDVKMLKYFKTFKSNDILENTIVIFLSDHGSRFGALVKLPGGFLEERLPIFYMSLPKWFKNQYPDFVKALQINRNRLTSPYDIHMTLKHILELSEPGLSLPIANGCAKCQSIFREVPENRSCADAGIPEHWCTCTHYENQSKKDKIVKYVTQKIIDQMNSYLKDKTLSKVCSELKLKDINTAHLKVEEDDGIQYNPTYRIRFVVYPKKANYEATAIYNPVKRSVELNVEDISCLSSYENVSQCINDKQAKKYCICK